MSDPYALRAKSAAPMTKITAINFMIPLQARGAYLARRGQMPAARRPSRPVLAWRPSRFCIASKWYGQTADTLFATGSRPGLQENLMTKRTSTIETEAI